MPAVSFPTTILVVAMLALSGCVGNVLWKSEESAETIGKDWTFVDYRESVSLSLEDLNHDDWVLLEFFHTESPRIEVNPDGRLDFENPAVNPELQNACIVYSGGRSNEDIAATAAPPFIVPERLYPGLVEVGPQPQLGVQSGDVEAHVSARSTGFGYGLGGYLLSLVGDVEETTYLAWGMADSELWRDQGLEYSVEIGKDAAFHYREVYRGSMDCRVQFEEYDQGEYVRTTHYTDASDLEATFQATEGLVAFISYASDMMREVKVVSPSGREVHANATSQSSTGISISPGGESIIICDDEPGDWTISYPRLEGTDHRWTYADTLFLDVPPEYQLTFDCAGTIVT